MATPKRPRLSVGNGKHHGLKTPNQVLEDMKIDGNSVDSNKIFRALCRCVVDASSESDEHEALHCLKQLLHNGANPNINDQSLLDITGGPPLHLAVKLNVPKAVHILCQHGASIIQVWEGKTAIHLAIELNASESLEEIYRHIKTLEDK